MPVDVLSPSVLLLWPAVLAALLLASWLPARTWPRGSARKQLALRCISASLLLLSLAQLRLLRPVDDLHVMFLIDRSASTLGIASSDLMNDIAELTEPARPNDRFGAIVFGSSPLVEANASGKPPVELFSSPSPAASNIAAALRLAQALLPPAGGRRLVLVSDGQETEGNAVAEADNLARAGIEVWTLPLASVPAPGDAAVVSVEVPNLIEAGAKVPLTVTVWSAGRTLGALRLLRDGVDAGQLEVDLTAGMNTIRLADTPKPDARGIAVYTVTVNVAGDPIPTNNSCNAAAWLEAPGALLLVAATEPEGRTLARLLAGSGLPLELTSPELMPASLEELASYSGIILINVPGHRLSGRQLELLRAFVQDLGCGLAMTGGPDAFGLGGYFRTPIEGILPVNLSLEDHMADPEVALAFLIDKSGSMSAGDATWDKIAVAREAAINAANLMGPRDWISVFAFDAAVREVVPLSRLADAPDLYDRISSIRAGGGTHIFPALSLAYWELDDSPARYRHAILMTDGRTMPGNFEKLVTEMWDHGIALSTVAIGADADLPFLEQLAEWGHGHHYYSENLESVPRIFSREMSLLKRNYMIERTFTVEPVLPSDLTAELSAFPDIHGIVGTRSRPDAELLLAVNDQKSIHPLLARRQVGLGRTLAFTSNPGSNWTQQWRQWPGHSALWSAAARWLAGPPTGWQRAAASMTFTGATGILTLEFTSSSAADAPPSAVSILHASEPAQSIELHPDGLGRWRGEFDASAGGVFVAALPGRAIPGVTPPPRELIPEPGRGEGLLAQLAERSGGKQVDDGRDLLRHDFPPGVAPENISRELLLASLLLFVLDIAYRRLGPLSRFRRAPSVTAAPAATPAESSAVTALLDLRERRRPVALPSAPRASFTPLSAPSAPAKPLAPPPTAGHSAAKLLEAKRDRQRGREDRAPTSE